MDQYSLSMMHKFMDIRDYILSTRAIVLSRLEIYFKYPVITYHAEQNGNVTGFYNPNVTQNCDGIFDISKPEFSIISKDLFARIFCIQSGYRFYIAIDKIYLDADSDISPASIAWINKINSVKDELNFEFEEFFVFIDGYLYDYLEKYPEDNIYMQQ